MCTVRQMHYSHASYFAGYNIYLTAEKEKYIENICRYISHETISGHNVNVLFDARHTILLL